MENKNELNKNYPVVYIKKDENNEDFGLIGIVGPELMFQRLGEFLAVMMEQDGFYITKVDGEEVSTELVDMEPKDGEVKEDSKEDMGEDSVNIG